MLQYPSSYSSNEEVITKDEALNSLANDKELLLYLRREELKSLLGIARHDLNQVLSNFEEALNGKPSSMSVVLHLAINLPNLTTEEARIIAASVLRIHGRATGVRDVTISSNDLATLSMLLRPKDFNIIDSANHLEKSKLQQLLWELLDLPSLKRSLFKASEEDDQVKLLKLFLKKGGLLSDLVNPRQVAWERIQKVRQSFLQLYAFSNDMTVGQAYETFCTMFDRIVPANHVTNKVTIITTQTIRERLKRFTQHAKYSDIATTNMKPHLDKYLGVIDDKLSRVIINAEFALVERAFKDGHSEMIYHALQTLKAGNKLNGYSESACLGLQAVLDLVCKKEWNSWKYYPSSTTSYDNDFAKCFGYYKGKDKANSWRLKILDTLLRSDLLPFFSKARAAAKQCAYELRSHGFFCWLARMRNFFMIDLCNFFSFGLSKMQKNIGKILHPNEDVSFPEVVTAPQRKGRQAAVAEAVPSAILTDSASGVSAAVTPERPVSHPRASESVFAASFVAMPPPRPASRSATLDVAAAPLSLVPSLTPAMAPA